MEQLKTLTLPNGLRVVIASRPFYKVFSACLNLRVGSCDDPADAVGVSHLAEHLAFRGETDAIYRELSGQSVHVNATTFSELTAFYTHGHTDFFHKGLRLLESVLRVEEISVDQCRHERQIVHQEMIDNEPDSLSRRSDRYKAFCRRVNGQPNWRWTEEPRQSSMLRLSAHQVNAFRQSYYRPENASLAIVAPIGVDELTDLANELFSPVSAAREASLSRRPGDNWRATPAVDFCFDWATNIWVYVVNTADDSRFVTRQAARLLSHVLGSGGHSDYFNHFRRNAAEAYHVRAEDEPWLNHTSLKSFVSINKPNAVDAVRYFIERGDRFAKEGFSDDQREQWKQNRRRWSEMQMESSYNLAEFLAYERLRSEDESMVDLLHADIASLLTKEGLDEAVRDILDPANRRVFVGGRVGPFMRRRIRRLLGV